MFVIRNNILLYDGIGIEPRAAHISYFSPEFSYQPFFLFFDARVLNPLLDLNVPIKVNS